MSYRSKPQELTGMPPGVPYIVGNEIAERFSFYGMKGILTVYMTQHLLNASGTPDYMSDEEAKSVYHLFTAAAYFFPLLGALLADIFFGKYKTILILSLGYCVGHGLLAFGDTGAGASVAAPKIWLFAGLIFIAIGAGGIKPCVSAHVGDQFGTKNKRLLPKVFAWFYFAINLGAMVSNLLTPVLLANYGPAVAFGVPGILMAIATLVFWLGRKSFVHVRASGWTEFKRETFSPEGVRALKNLAPLFLIIVPVFWAIFDQTGSAWVIQAETMDRNVMGTILLESQVQALNPLFILLLIPIFSYIVYPTIDKVWRMTPLRKIGIGLFLTVLAAGTSALIEVAIEGSEDGPREALVTSLQSTSLDEVALTLRGELEDDAEDREFEAVEKKIADVGEKLAELRLTDAIGPDGEVDKEKEATTLADAVQLARDAGLSDETINEFTKDMPNLGWQILAYLLLTAAEVMVSITTLEFAYTQAPRRMKSFIMGVYFLGVSFGNFFVAGINALMSQTSLGETLEGSKYYWFFTGLMLVTAIGYIFLAKLYRGQTYIQGESNDPNDADDDTETFGEMNA